MKRLPRLLLFLIVPALVLPVVLYLRDRLARPRPMEPLAGCTEPLAEPPLGACFMGPPPPIEPVMVHELALLLPVDAARLDDQRLRFRVQVAGPPDRRKVGDAWRDEYEVLPRGDPQGVLQLEAGPDVQGVLVVEATLKVVRHRAGATYAAFTEYMLEDVRRTWRGSND